MAAADDPRIVTIRNYQRIVADARHRLLTVARRAWGAQAAYHREDVDGFLELFMPQLIAGRIGVAQVADVAQATFTGTTPTGVDPSMAHTLRRGVTDEEVYARPFRQVWMNLAHGKPLHEAVDAGMVRLVSLIETDLQLAKQAQEQATLSSTPARFYRRVLTGAENCALCVIASTQRYFVGELSGVHPGCDCSVAPILGNLDPGHVINQPLLEQMHYQVEGFAGDSDRSGQVVTPDGRVIDYSNILIADHPEFGPTLGWRDGVRPRPTLEPHEVEFGQRFARAGHQFTWIPKDKTAPTNDFVWQRKDGEIAVELKSTKARWETIRSRIEKSARTAVNHPWAPTIKENFVIDLGDAPLTEELRRDIATYNVGRRKYRISRLWVMSQGIVEEVHLNK